MSWIILLVLRWNRISKIRRKQNCIIPLSIKEKCTYSVWHSSFINNASNSFFLDFPSRIYTTVWTHVLDEHNHKFLSTTINYFWISIFYPSVHILHIFIFDNRQQIRKDVIMNTLVSKNQRKFLAENENKQKLIDYFRYVFRYVFL